MINKTDICAFGLKDYFIRERMTDISEPDIIQVNKCREYIREYLKPDRRGHSSYHFKHAVEEHYNYYIANGAFIQAAILEGCNIERISLHSPNVRIFMTYRKRSV